MNAVATTAPPAPAKRMSLAAVRTTGEVTSIRLAIIGQAGVGKTTFAASIPGAILLPVEDGAAQIEVPRFPQPETAGDVFDAIKELIETDHPYKAVAIDGLDALEQLVWKRVCDDAKVANIEAVGGGFGKGFTAAMEVWRSLLAQLDRLRRAKGMHVVLIGHTEVRAFNDPTQLEPYDRFEQRLNKKVAGLIAQWVDGLGFAVHDDMIVKGERKAVGTGARFLRMHHSPAMDAKNRWGLERDLPLSWPELQTAIDAATNIDTVRAAAAAIIEQIADPARKKKAVEWLAAQHAPGNIRAQIDNLRDAAKKGA